jgi:hypothetical protein
MTMIRYLAAVPCELPAGARLVHNFCPGPNDDPGRHRAIAADGFRVWITDEPLDELREARCYCGWLDGREHYGTVGRVDEHGRFAGAYTT